MMRLGFRRTCSTNSNEIKLLTFSCNFIYHKLFFFKSVEHAGAIDRTPQVDHFCFHLILFSFDFVILLSSQTVLIWLNLFHRHRWCFFFHLNFYRVHFFLWIEYRWIKFDFTKLIFLIKINNFFLGGQCFSINKKTKFHTKANLGLWFFTLCVCLCVFVHKK